MRTFIRYISIAVNVAVMVLLAFLIYDEAGTLRWLHGVNQLWFFFGAVAIVVLAALLAEWSERGKPATSQVSQAAEPSRAGQAADRSSPRAA